MATVDEGCKTCKHMGKVDPRGYHVCRLAEPIDPHRCGWEYWDMERDVYWCEKWEPRNAAR